MSANHARKWQESYKPATKQVTVRVHRKGWVTKGERLLYSIVAACTIAAGIYTVSYAASTDMANRQLQKVESQVKQQKRVNNDLSYEIKELSTPERITKIAKKNGLKIQDAKVKQAELFDQ